MKILLSAYACEPQKGSEPGVGWNWVRQIARFADDVWVLTRTNNRNAIEKALKEAPLPNVHWVYFDLPSWARFWKKGQRGVHLYYYLWQIGIFFEARRLHQRFGFDLMHHVTFVNYWMPSFLSLLPAPFVWGPVGGGDSTPRLFYKTFSWRGKGYEYAREAMLWLGEHDIFTRQTARRCAWALATTEATASRLKSLRARRVSILSQVALPEAEVASLGTLSLHKGKPFRFLSLGRLLHWKGFHLGLAAFARLARVFPESEYWLVGDGPERRRLERLAEALGVRHKVRFWGTLPRAEALKKLAECDVLVHPSLHDSGGWVIVEAMAAGRPVICLDLGGPALQVTEETGFKIPARAPEQVIAGIAEAMRQLTSDRGVLLQMSQAARRRVRDGFTWEKRGEQIAELYRSVLSKSADCAGEGDIG
ncbi:glycosyltransferase [Candidatus Parcubacteria bacterium]|nr:MAG: glycosyltransferase [Candidatus Parcubacteria bacterium]